MLVYNIHRYLPFLSAYIIIGLGAVTVAKGKINQYLGQKVSGGRGQSFPSFERFAWSRSMATAQLPSSADKEELRVPSNPPSLYNPSPLSILWFIREKNGVDRSEEAPPAPNHEHAQRGDGPHSQLSRTVSISQ